MPRNGYWAKHARKKPGRSPPRPAALMPTTSGSGHRGTLSKALIVSRAVDLAREEGLTAVTMRRIAGDLGVEAMSLYHYIPTKATLLVLMADWSLSRVPSPDPDLPWSGRLVGLLVHTYLAGVENPLLFEVIACEPHAEQQVPPADADTGAASAAFVETVLALLEESGLPVGQQVDAYRGLIGILIGFIVMRAGGFLTSAAQSSRRRAPQGAVPEVATPSLRLARMGRLLNQADPVAALRTNLGWFLEGLVGTGPAQTSGDTG
jgi:AcrR family transcriptional regulator